MRRVRTLAELVFASLKSGLKATARPGPDTLAKKLTAIKLRRGRRSLAIQRHAATVLSQPDGRRQERSSTRHWKTWKTTTVNEWLAVKQFNDIVKEFVNV